LKYQSFPELLAEQGYFTGYTGKGWGPGNFKVDGRKENPAGPAFSSKKNKPPYSGISGTDYAENFAEFLRHRQKGQPFCFWYGAHEPHRGFEKGSGLKSGKKLVDVDVPAFLPDTPEVRSDILDYYTEIEWFDTHLARIVKQLEDAGELENTLIIVTSDNGMAFPRAKANCYEYGIHMPLAIRWGKRVPGGRTVKDLVGFVDLTATILEASEVDVTEAEFQQPERRLAGRSILGLLERAESGVLDPSRKAVFSARERHSSSRYHNLAYPIRSMRTQKYLYIRNFRPERLPAGPPQIIVTKNGETSLSSINSGFPDIDGCPTLQHLIDLRDDPTYGNFLKLATDHRPAVEVYDIKVDPACLRNLALEPSFRGKATVLDDQFELYLKESGDPRVVNPDGGDVFETYRRYSPIRKFPEPEWAQEYRERMESKGWVQLFDGESLEGWKVAGNAKSFEVINGMIRANGIASNAKGEEKPIDMAHLYYVGPDGKAGTEDDDFRDFDLTFDALATPASNGGIYFHTSWQEENFPNDGHEVQVNNSHHNKTRTGSLFGVVDLKEATTPDESFLTETVSVRGKQVTIAVNGTQVVDYTEPADYSHPVYTGRNVDHGTFCLQAHDGESTVWYRNIWVRRR